MIPDLALKLGIVALVLTGSFFIWYGEQQGTDVQEQLKAGTIDKLPFNFTAILGTTGLGELNYCPFINPYMSELFTAGSLEVPPSDAMQPLDPAAKPGIHPALEYIVDADYFCDKNLRFQYNYDSNAYDAYCGNQFVESVDVNETSERLNQYVDKTGSGLALDQQIPNWQCFAFFGVIPFVAMFFFMRDLLGFTMLSQRLKTLVTLFASFVAIMTGGFAKFVWQLAYVASLSVGATLLLVLLLMSFFSVLLSWVASLNLAMSEAKRQASETAAGLAQKYTFAAVAKSLEKKP